jgi:hypothetical protein
VFVVARRNKILSVSSSVKWREEERGGVGMMWLPYI